MFAKIKLMSVIPHTRKSDFDNITIDIVNTSKQAVISEKLRLINHFYSEQFELYEKKVKLEKELLFGINRKLLEMDFEALAPLNDKYKNNVYTEKEALRVS